MTKRLITCLSALLILLGAGSCSANKDSFRINGVLDGLKDGTVVELIPGATHKSEKAIATDTVKSGKFSFKGTLNEPRKFYIAVSGQNNFGTIPVMVEPSVIKIIGKVSLREDQGKRYYNFEELEITGSVVHQEYLEKISPKNYLNKLYEDYHKQSKGICDSVMDARVKKDQQLLSELYRRDSWKKFEQDEKNFFNTVDVTMEKMILDNANSWWGPFLMMDQMSYFTKQQEEWWKKFSDEAKNSYYGLIVKDELFPVGLKDKMAPEFKTVNKEGKEYTSAGLFKGKKYILIDFWASWCKPCRNEIPNFRRAYDLFSKKGFEIVSISIDNNEHDWSQALSEENLPWPNFLDRSEIANAYNVKLIPSTFLVNEKGVVLEDNLRGEALIKKLEELLP
jgi:peroxiredoxin